MPMGNFGLEQPCLRRTIRNSEVVVGELRCDAAPGRSLEKPDLQQVWLVHVLDSVHFFAEHGGNRIHTDRTSAEPLDNGPQQLAIDLVEAVFINV